MASAFSLYATHAGGTVHEFEQKIYIHHTGWASVNPNQRKGALTEGEGFKNGVCLGLCCLWMSGRGKWSSFMNNNATPRGLSIVRGFMNMQSEFNRVGPRNDSDIVERHKLLMQALGITYTGSKRNARNKQVARGVSNFVPSCDALYLLTFWGQDGHAIAFQTDGEAVTIFDPNFGHATLPSAINFRIFITWFFPYYYPSFNQGWILMQFRV